MSFAQVSSFVAVAEEGSLRAASLRLHVTEPPLSRRLKDLEDELGVRLFARTARGMRLLPEGERFLVHARRILSAVDEAHEAMRPATLVR